MVRISDVSGQASTALILIIVLMVIIVGVIAFVMVQGGIAPSQGTQPANQWPSPSGQNMPNIQSNPLSGPSAQPSVSWCVPGQSYSDSSYSGTIEGMSSFSGYDLCKVRTSVSGQDYFFYGNEDLSIWYLTDQWGNVIASYLDSLGPQQSTGTATQTGSSWCPSGRSQPFVVGGLTGDGAVIGLETYGGEQMCKASFSSNGKRYDYYESQDGSRWYLLDASDNVVANHDFPMAIDSSGSTTGAGWTWLIEGGITELDHGKYADFVNAHVVPGDAWPDCDLEVTPFSLNGQSQGTLGFRSCGDENIADLGILPDFPTVWDSDLQGVDWIRNPTAVKGHVYAMEARDGSMHYFEVLGTDMGSETVTISWVAD